MDENILLKYFTRSLDALQEQQVEAWFNESDENRKIAEDIYYIYYSTQTLQQIRKTNPVEALKKVNKKIGCNRNQKSFIYQFQRIAAILAIPLLCTTLYFLLQKEADHYLEFRTNPGMVASFKLPDNSEVWLNSSSYLKCPVNFSGNTRKVHLEGEAYFAVTKSKKQKFVVETASDVKVEVLGTEFNVEAYPDDDYISTTLVTGKVEVKYYSQEGRETSQILHPGERAMYNKKNLLFESEEVPVLVNVAWKDMKVVLRKTPLEEMIKILSKRFDVDFIILNKDLKNNTYTGTFDEQQLDDVLEGLKLSTGIRYRIITCKSNEHGVKKKKQVELF
ncbi:FecR family protein [Bacteroides sp. 519]|uniref:FecR family protein n=1 Tax=Bacteroides sp. 519 TaxID=2302937 RepID=UPI0013D4BE2E|nr:FecR domain-containing protein [Bacteroides sp. 519]NDV58300.1 DUF4974 domain-containing protein [Bacteroides sp. 519]